MERDHTFHLTGATRAIEEKKIHLRRTTDNAQKILTHFKEFFLWSRNQAACGMLLVNLNDVTVQKSRIIRKIRCLADLFTNRKYNSAYLLLFAIAS